MAGDVGHGLACQAALHSLLATLRAVLPAPAVAASGAGAAADAAATLTQANRDALIARLLALLQADDPKAQKLLAEHETVFTAAFGAQFKAVQSAIADFALDEALDIANAVLSASTDQQGSV